MKKTLLTVGPGLFFFQQVKYHTSSKTKTINNCVAKLKHGKLEGGGKDVWMSEKLMIPPLPPSYLQYCKIIDIKYFAMVSIC